MEFHETNPGRHATTTLRNLNKDYTKQMKHFASNQLSLQGLQKTNVLRQLWKKSEPNKTMAVDQAWEILAKECGKEKK